MDLDEFKNHIAEVLETEEEEKRIEQLETLENKFSETLNKLQEYESKISKYKEDNAKLRNKLWLGTSTGEPTINNVEQIPTKKSYDELVENILKGGKF